MTSRIHSIYVPHRVEAAMDMILPKTESRQDTNGGWINEEKHPSSEIIALAAGIMAGYISELQNSGIVIEELVEEAKSND